MDDCLFINRNSNTLAKINSSVKQYFGSQPADLFQKKVFL